MSDIFLSQDEFERIFKSHLKIEVYSKSVESLFSARLSNKINYQPYYQRNYVWDESKATYFLESILLGTEIPPLIFFNNGDTIEIVDGRQRYESIKRYMDNEFKLTKKGLSTLTQLAKLTFAELGSHADSLTDVFLDAKLRIIEFAIVNDPPMDESLRDKTKKEIFSRYNSGITPLKRAEIDNAIYVNDEISNHFKSMFKKDNSLAESIYDVFFKPRAKEQPVHIESVLQFIRRFLVLYMFPIRNYAIGGARTELLAKLYDILITRTQNVAALCESFIRKVDIVIKIKQELLESKTYNHLVFETIIWALSVIENEGYDLKNLQNEAFINGIKDHLAKNFIRYPIQDHHYYKVLMDRFLCTMEFFERFTGCSFVPYVGGGEEARQTLKDLRSNSDPLISKINQLQSLRITKPDPSRQSIDDILRVMGRRRFLVRPPYQRSEVINLTKASAIIESILLDIALPAIFIFKRNDGISEVIDGQQRILTILGYIGKSYVDEDNDTRLALNNCFPLRGLRILKDLNGKNFENLDKKMQDKILDFELFVVEIEERLNPHFNPVDLFIRLNDKPFPIRENSFEMWNSWAHKDIISLIRRNTKKHLTWFNRKVLKSASDRDRMENEELYTALVYLEYKRSQDSADTYLDIHQKEQRINARLSDKSDISRLLEDISTSESERKLFEDSIRNIEKFISKLQIILLDKDTNKSELDAYLSCELDEIIKAKRQLRQFRRRMQDFYILWYLLTDINPQMVKHHRLVMKEQITDIFHYMKNIPLTDTDNKGFKNFMEKVATFRNTYKCDVRKLRLSEQQKQSLISAQGHQCPISKAPIFIGDDLEADHCEAIAIGGPDKIENIQITHKDANRGKGVKRTS